MTLAIHETNVDNINSILKKGLLIGEKYPDRQSPHYEKRGSFLLPTDSLDKLVTFINRSPYENKSFVQNGKTPLYLVVDISNECKVGDCEQEGDYHPYCRSMTTLDDYTKNNRRSQYETPEIFCEQTIPPGKIVKVLSREQLFELYTKCDSIPDCVSKEIKKDYEDNR
jgi:hypothetical protein